MAKPVRPKTYDRPGKRPQNASTPDLKAPSLAREIDMALEGEEAK